MGEAVTFRANGPDTVRQRLSAKTATTTPRAMVHTAPDMRCHLAQCEASYHRPRMMLRSQSTTSFLGLVETPFFFAHCVELNGNMYMTNENTKTKA